MRLKLEAKLPIDLRCEISMGLGKPVEPDEWTMKAARSASSSPSSAQVQGSEALPRASSS